MECRLLGWPEDGPRLRLDHRRFAYAGKFVTGGTGKAVVVDGEDGSDAADGLDGDEAVVAAVSFSRDRTDATAWWLRVVTVRGDRRGEGIGPRLLSFAADRLLERGSTVRIAVNNPFAYEAAYKAGFGYAGERTGLAELVLERPGDRSATAYREGLSVYRSRDDLSGVEAAFVDGRDGTVPSLATSWR